MTMNRNDQMSPVARNPVNGHQNNTPVNEEGTYYHYVKTPTHHNDFLRDTVLFLFARNRH